MDYSGNPCLEGSFAEYLAQSYPSYSKQPTYEFLSIRLSDTKEHIGNCAIYNIDFPQCEAQIGIMIGERKYWNKGYGQKTMQQLIKYVQSEYNEIMRLYLHTRSDNIRAIRCFEKSGFHHSGSLLKGGVEFLIMETYLPSIIDSASHG